MGARLLGAFVEVIAPFMHEGRPVEAGEVIEIDHAKALYRLRAGEAAPARLLTTPIVWMPSEGASIYEALRAVAASYLDLNGAPIALDPRPSTPRLRASRYRGQKPWPPPSRQRRYRGTSGWVQGWKNEPRSRIQTPPVAEIDALARRYLMDGAVADFFARLESGSLVADGVFEKDLQDRRTSAITARWWSQDISLDLVASALHEHIGPGADATARRYSNIRIKNYSIADPSAGRSLQDAIQSLPGWELNARAHSGAPDPALPEPLLQALQQGRVVASGRPESARDGHLCLPPILWIDPMVTVEIEPGRLLYRRLDLIEPALLLGDLTVALNGMTTWKEAFQVGRQGGTSAAETEARMILREMAKNGEIKTKTAALREVHRRVPEVSGRAADRAWSDVAKDHPWMSKVGRRLKP